MVQRDEKKGIVVLTRENGSPTLSVPACYDAGRG